ncbi:MAG: hypothetical protein KA782_05530 [Flavobacterium sp.]|nr:hypothetical protein [Flavobacterium sp.]MBP6587340.1 hypothetical protein [Flavobacterium sp.]MBP7470533.1 hypothetical protein [Flavobacterium sp.]
MNTFKVISPKKMNSIKEKTNPKKIILLSGILFIILLFIVKTSWINIGWKMPLIPLMIALQIIFLASTIKNRYKKL